MYIPLTAISIPQNGVAGEIWLHDGGLQQCLDGGGDCGSTGLDLEDSPGPEVLAFLDGGALRAGLGCDGASGVGPTRVWYLLGEGASEEEPTVGLPWVAAVVIRVVAAAGATVAAAAVSVGVARGAAATAVVVGGAGAGGGEELCTLGRKVCPPRVFTMVGPEEERRWRGEFQTGNEDLK